MERFYRLPSILPFIVLLLAACGQAQTAPPSPQPVTVSPTNVAAVPSPTTAPLAEALSDALPTIEAGTFDVPALRVGAAAPTAAPTSEAFQFAPDQPVRLVLPTIELDRSLTNVGLDENLIPIVPKHDVGWYHYSARPGGDDNIVLWGHVLRFRDTPDIPAPFARLNELQIGDPLTLYTSNGDVFDYVVSEQIWATPDQVDYILPQDSEMVTLVSCVGDIVIAEDSVEMSHRLITIARPDV